ncbi:predicted protein [Lichtheimia corymbifera JMRC:FSU:9682]|uniref:Uncharacterized protein n=1 Tax=Lichtheimia corymbifera JMRC:FSU:9682 TaxID=1263082 RepID=A0A068S5Z1_9FUNG|nr:predicted protein [Lichtheimia corymbifera JMRC:FSU:9682]
MMKEGLQATRHPLFKDMDWSYRGVQGLYVLEVVEWSDADMAIWKNSLRRESSMLWRYATVGTIRKRWMKTGWMW